MADAVVEAARDDPELAAAVEASTVPGAAAQGPTGLADC